MGRARRREQRGQLQRTLRDLEAVASRLAIPVRYEKGDMRGGLCRVAGCWQIIINAELAEEEKADLLAQSLAQTDLESVYIPPRVRQRIEQARSETSQTEERRWERG